MVVQLQHSLNIRQVAPNYTPGKYKLKSEPQRKVLVISSVNPTRDSEKAPNYLPAIALGQGSEKSILPLIKTKILVAVRLK